MPDTSGWGLGAVGGPYAVLAGTFLPSLSVAGVRIVPASVVAGVYLAATSSEP